MSYRKAGKAIAGIFFPIALTLFVFALSLSQVTQNGGLKDFFIGVLSSQVPQGVDKASIVDSFKAQCSGKESMELDLGNETLFVQCSRILESRTLEDAAGAIFDAQYARRYDCSFLDCARFVPAIIPTKQGNEIMTSLSYAFLALSALFGAMLVASLEGFGRITWLGVAIVSVGVLYFPLEYMPSVAGGLETGIVRIFASNFFIVLCAGAALAAVGLVFGLLKKKRQAQ
ncbi:MAG TPA: hypothetical protein VI979_00040 [archaeon]|nr:hypothetical protein [archaeon]